MLNGKHCRSRSVGFYTVCKGWIYPGLAGLGIIDSSLERGQNHFIVRVASPESVPIMNKSIGKPGSVSKKYWLIGKYSRPWSNWFFQSSLMWMYTTYSGMSVRIFKANMVWKRHFSTTRHYDLRARQVYCPKMGKFQYLLFKIQFIWISNSSYLCQENII